ncbi:hypothetical protein WJX84_002476 [Apatococcus fuscideae]|uniref:BCNT-C domain-containing protein n=1 Tax=Apatococcus fuscideae TaxID=2026836 RepID=A0AAW1SXZ8_9CHLO
MASLLTADLPSEDEDDQDFSRGDWMAFKKSDQAANEELIAHTNSNKRYLDKVDFLKRAELNEYEQETAKRLKGDIRLRGQL